MSTITQPNITINGQSIWMQTYLEIRAQNALLLDALGTNQQQDADDLDSLRQDAAFDAGVPQAAVVL